MTYYALTDTDWPWTDDHEGRPIIMVADSQQDAVERATEKYMEENPYSGGVSWKVAKVTPIGFEYVHWEESCHPQYNGFTHYTDMVETGPIDNKGIKQLTKRADTHGGPAYPIECYLKNGIMQAEDKTLRDDFAGLALMGMMASERASDDLQYLPEKAAERAYLMADAMLARKMETDPEPYDVSKEWAE